MNMEDYFTNIEDVSKTEDDLKKESIANNQDEENTFVNKLPEWDLEPPYETIRREQD